MSLREALVNTPLPLNKLRRIRRQFENYSRPLKEIDKRFKKTIEKDKTNWFLIETKFLEF